MKIALVAYFFAIGLVISAPLARHFTDAIPYTRVAPGAQALHVNAPGDHLQLYYRLWLLGDSLLGNAAPYRNRYEFSIAPDHVTPLASYFLPFSLIFLLFRPLGPAAGYNAAMLASFVFSGLAMYALALHYTRDRAAALVAGTAYAATPYAAISAFAGHPIGLVGFSLPLSILLLERLLLTRSWRIAAAAGALFVVIGDSELHALYFVALLCPLFVARHFAGVRPRAWAAESRALLVPILVATVPAAAAVALKLSLMAPAASVGGPPRSLREVAAFAPRLADLFNRSGLVVPSYVYPGAATVLVAALGLAALVLRRDRPSVAHIPRRTAFFYACLFAGSLLLAFGPQPPLGGPYRFLYEHLPKFSLLRQTAKLMLPASFALAVLAGLGFAALKGALPGRKGLLAAAVAVLAIVADGSPLLRPGTGFSLLPARVEAYERVFRDRPGARVVNVPIWPGNDAWTSHYLYYTTLYRTVMVNGYNPLVPAGYEEEVFRPLAGLNAGQVQRSQYELLRRMGVEHLIFHEESFPAKVCLFPAQYALDNLLASPYLELASREAPVTVLRLRTPEEIGAAEERFVSSPVGVALPAWRSGEGERRPDAGAISGTALMVAGGSGGARLQRPRTTPAGAYALTLNVRPIGTVRFSLQVRRGADEAVLAERSFTESGEGYRPVTLEVSLPTSAPVYYQVQPDAGGSLAVDWLYLRFAEQQDPLSGFEFDDLYHTGNTIRMDGASGGRVLLLTAADPGGQVTRGPYRLYGPGRYVLTARLALPAGTNLSAEAVVASLTLRNHQDEIGGERDLPRNVLMPERTITAGQLAGGGIFRELAFPFALERPVFLSVNLEHSQRGLLADRVVVARVDP